MSGGSYNYLCDREAEDLIGNWYKTLQEMSEDLHSKFPNSMADKHTDELVRLIGHLKVEVERRAIALRDVWHAQEWWRSSDYGIGEVEVEIARYEAGCK
jgi:hypothetical protein